MSIISYNEKNLKTRQHLNSISIYKFKVLVYIYQMNQKLQFSFFNLVFVYEMSLNKKKTNYNN